MRCTEWQDFAPYCLDGVCSQCATDEHCTDAECVPNWQGFGTCLPVKS